MPEAEPLEVLMKEHRMIERVLSCLETMALISDRTGGLESADARKAIEFFRGFADGCHHGKEEKLLFDLLEKRGFPSHEGPTAQMTSEHQEGRDLVRSLETAVDEFERGEKGALDQFSDAARRYVSLLRSHIQKEDQCLFPMAFQALSVDDLNWLQREFQSHDVEDAKRQEHTRFERISDELAARYEAPHPAGS